MSTTVRSSLPHTAASVAVAGGRAHAGAAAAAHAAGSGGPDLVVVSADGRRRRVSLQHAISVGLVTIDARGTVHATPAGRLARVAPAMPAGSVSPLQGPARPAGAPPAAFLAGGRIHPAAGPAAWATLAHAEPAARPEGPASDGPPRPSEMMGKLASAAFLARGVLKIAQGPGMPAWQTVYFAANGLNKFTGGNFTPKWLQKGPVKQAVDLAIVAEFLGGSVKAAPKALTEFRGNVAAARAAADGAKLGVGSLLKAAFRKSAPAADAAAGAAKVGRPNVNSPLITKLFPLIKPLMYLGFTMSALAGVVALPEHLREKGTAGLLTTTSGRGAVLGAASGVAMLGALYLPASPGQVAIDAVSNVLWLAELVNGWGWLDPLLGADPTEPPKPAVPAEGAHAAPPGSGAEQSGASQSAPATAAVAVVPAITQPAVTQPARPATPAAPAARGRRRRRPRGAPAGASPATGRRAR